MRDKTLHYPNNPEFSPLVPITPCEAPEKIAEETAEAVALKKSTPA